MYILIIIGLYLLWVIVLKPLIKDIKSRQLNLFNPNLNIDEIKLLANDHTPTEEDIVLYYKMYIKKFDMMKEQEWTTQQPMSFKTWEDRAKTKTKISPMSKDMAFVVTGGYQYMIPMTCDTMIGIPPNQIYHRYHDYKNMVLKGES